MTITERILSSRTLAALASPHGVDRYLEHLNPMWAATEVRARVVDISPEAAGVATLTLQPTATWRGHRAGQFVQVGVELPESAKRLTRCFSISSAASAPGERFMITVRAHRSGGVSDFLVHRAAPGQILHLSQAEGEFTLPGSPATPSPYPLLLISGGSGITPVMSHVRTLLRDGYDGRANRKVVFVHFARSADDQIYAAELDRIARTDNDVQVHTFYGDQQFSAIRLAGIVPSFREIDTWACGPAPMIEAVRTAYDGSDRLRLEFFKPPSTANDDAEGEVRFSRSALQAPNTGASLLEQAEALGLEPQFGCRMGICFSCTATKTEGVVRNVLTGEISPAGEEQIRLCVSAPEGACSIDL